MRVASGAGNTVPGARIAPVTAHSIASINQIAPGRTFLGIGIGGSGMRLLGQEMKHLREETAKYTAGALHDLVNEQQEDGTWPLKGWVRSNGGENTAYSTAYATLTLSIPDGRLSVLNRDRPKLAAN